MGGNLAARSTKRLLDLLLGGLCLTLSAPVQALTALLIYMDDGAPLFFVQERTGWRGETIRLVKFRSMYVNDLPAIDIGRVTSEHHLVTRVGRVARRFKLDELPQLFNVLRGELSLVGPRPALIEQTIAYNAFQRRRLSVKPGLTGWTQVNGGTALDPVDRIAMDVWYVDHWSLRLDFLILARTAAALAFGERPSDTAVTAARLYAAKQMGPLS